MRELPFLCWRYFALGHVRASRSIFLVAHFPPPPLPPSRPRPPSDSASFGPLAAKGITLAQMDAAANASAAAVGAMVTALAAVDPSVVPSTNPAGYAGAVRAVGVTKGYLEAYFSWRAAG